MEEIFPECVLPRFERVVLGLCYDLGEGYDFSRHGTGLSLWYKGCLYFVCCKHSFHGESLVGPKYHNYDSLCFLTEDGGKVEHPPWRRVFFNAFREGETCRSHEDMVIYEIQPSNCETYRKMRMGACVLDSSLLLKAIKRYGGCVYVVGYPNIHGGNVVDETHYARNVVGRNAVIKKVEDGHITCEMDVSGLTDSSDDIGSYGIDGMSGGAALTLDYRQRPLLVGMLTAGTVESKRIHLYSAGFMEFVLDNWLKKKATIEDSGEA